MTFNVFPGRCEIGTRIFYLSITNPARVLVTLTKLLGYKSHNVCLSPENEERRLSEMLSFY